MFKAYILKPVYYTSENMLDEKDLQLLELIQENCKVSLKELARKVNLPVTTTHARLKKLEKMGLIKNYQAILDAKKLGFGVTAFILISFSYRPGSGKGQISQREIARKIASFPEVQEVHIITGDWDMIVKVKVKDVNELGRFVVDRLRTVEGVDKTLTCVVLDTAKESLAIPVDRARIVS